MKVTSPCGTSLMSRAVKLMLVSLLAHNVHAQTAGSSVKIVFEANNASGVDGFTNNRTYTVNDSSFAMQIGGVSGTFTAFDAKDFSVTDSQPGTGFPFEDSFRESGGIWKLNDPNQNVNDGPGESLTVDFLFSSDSATNNIISSKYLADLVGQSFAYGDFQSDPAFPIGAPVINIKYTPPGSNSQTMSSALDSISFSQGSTKDLVLVTINGTVSSNKIEEGGTSVSNATPEPSSAIFLALGTLGLVGFRKRKQK